MRFILTCVILVLLSSCKKDSNEITDDFSLTVQVLSGWCDGKEIRISEQSTKVTTAALANCQQTASTREGATDQTKLKELKSLLLATAFKSLSLQECARCADGTDYKITLSDKGKKYENTIAREYSKEGLDENKKKLEELLTLLDTF